MSTSDHSASGAVSSASDVAARLRGAEFIRLITTPDGDALAATGVLARMLTVPFQASVAWGAVGESEADMTVTVGRSDGDVAITDEPLSVHAFEIARALDSDSSAVEFGSELSGVRALTLAGIVAAERDVNTYADMIGVDNIDRRPGVGVPTVDLADGLAHTTLVHAPFSGDVAAATDTLSEIDSELSGLEPDSSVDTDETGRAVASMLAFSVAGEARTRASTAIERAIHPVVLSTTGTGVEDAQTPFATLAGYADVLDALARSWPGIGLALALGHDCYDAALDGWREHARVAHAAVRNADLDRYRDFVVVDAAETDADGGTIGTIARLVRDYRSVASKSIVFAITDGAVAGTTNERAREQKQAEERTQTITTILTEAMTAVGDEDRVTGRGQYAYAPLELETTTERDALVDAFREVL